MSIHVAISAKDMTAVAGAVAAEAARREEERARADPNKKQIWRFIWVDKAYMKSRYGVFLITEMVLSVLAIICVSIPKDEACAFLYGSTYSYFNFITRTCLILTVLWFILFAFSIPSKVKCVRWDIAEIVWLIFCVINYFISTAVLMSHTCGQKSYEAAVVFGFMCFGVLLVHQAFQVRSCMVKRHARVVRGGVLVQ